ncbi:D-galactarate dehydratase [Silicimonas algicola]|uniref:D-galactarate dehydratase n=1 Tax=Silicimonas algicola TaxID=1826607 RepID=A0A316GR57_9RHOB|nr:D-galactarate dehydratase [Silicimonas algicola]AZQ68078.1 D-galactarate dehydratase [Silicimonas algicola]PWK57467.1 hypothetical protein C8D95_102110 [Silicimonas algicola]
MKLPYAVAILAVLPSCATLQGMTSPREAAPVSVVAPAPPPPRTARTVEQFDTTTAEQKARAASVSGGTSLGTTVASLGDPAAPGFWIETPLVTEAGRGRVVYQGKSVEVDLRPGPSSRVSLGALRVLGAPLTDLAEVEVFVL